jgi:hypothetical protein
VPGALPIHLPMAGPLHFRLPAVWTRDNHRETNGGEMAAKRTFVLHDRSWKVVAQSSTIAQSRAAGDPPPEPPAAGLGFLSVDDACESWFLPLPPEAVPTQAEFDAMVDAELADRLALAREPEAHG